MRADRLEIVVRDVTYECEAMSLKGGLTVTVTATAGGAVLHSDQINLDKAAAREKFAERIGQPANDLFDLRDALMEHLTGPAEPDQTEEQPDPTIEAAACDLLDGPDILDQAAGVMSALGYQAPAGAEHLPKLVYLTLTSRLLTRPLNLVVTGPSSAGKSFLVSTVCRLVPANGVLCAVWHVGTRARLHGRGSATQDADNRRSGGAPP